jgi:RNA polymerase sigma-70 factor (ECF subfamily)
MPQAERERWFKEEVHTHGGQLKSYLRGSFPAVRDVEDVVQESFLRLWRIRAKEEIRSAKALLFRVARHLALDQVRRNRASPIDSAAEFFESSALSHEPNAAEVLIARETFERVGDAIIALPAHYREVIILHKLEGLTQKEVAARLNLTPRSVEKYVERGIVRIARHLRTHGIHGL